LPVSLLRAHLIKLLTAKFFAVSLIEYTTIIVA